MNQQVGRTLSGSAPSPAASPAKGATRQAPASPPGTREASPQIQAARGASPSPVAHPLGDDMSDSSRPESPEKL